MKEVMAIVRGTKVHQTKDALTEAGFTRFTNMACLGRGKQLLEAAADKLLKLVEEGGDEDMMRVAKAMVDPRKLLPKRLFHIMVEDDQVQSVVDVLIAANATGHSGDGEIFIIPVLEAYSVCLGQAYQANQGS